SPVRLSVAAAWRAASDLSVGAAWRHFTDDDNAPIDGIDTFDLGAVWRLTGALALAGVVRDVATPVVDGVPTQRRWSGELLWRPCNSDGLEVGGGPTVGDRRGDVDPTFRASVRVARGIWLRGAVTGLGRWVLDDPFARAGAADLKLDGRAWLGVEVSLGEVG